MRALVVEPRESVRILLAQVLRRRGHEVEICPDARSGWMAFQHEAFGLVVAAEGALGGNLAWCRRVRHHRHGQHCVILLSTNRAEPAALEAILDAGVDDYLPEPIDLGLLGVRLAAAERRRAELLTQVDAEAARQRFELKMRHAQKLESLGVLAGGVAHDFNNFLVGILGHAALLLDELDDQSPLRSYVERIETAGIRASELAKQMLAYSGRGTAVIENVSLNDVVTEMGRLLEVCTAKTVELDFDLSRERPAVVVDPTQLRQVIMNLITNASDSLGNQRGTIKVRTGTVEVAEGGEVEVLPEALGPGRYGFLEVEDEGRGMSDEVVRRIFDPFFTTKSTGRGLGLAALMSVVRAHGGGVSVVSVPGEGSLFRVLLPLGPAPVGAAVAASPADVTERPAPLAPSPGSIPRSPRGWPTHR